MSVTGERLARMTDEERDAFFEGMTEELVRHELSKIPSREGERIAREVILASESQY